jgi:hypothetical protein
MEFSGGKLKQKGFFHSVCAPIYKKDEALKKLAALHLFVETLPINKVVTSGKGNRLFTG